MATGPCDYLLFIAGKACGVIEAKPAGATLSSVTVQAQGYQPQVGQALARWSDPMRFDYEASGTETQFSDRLDPLHRSRRLFAFHRPKTLHAWLKAGWSFRCRLAGMPPLPPDGLPDCDIHKMEASLARDKQPAIVRMATGAGETSTAATPAAGPDRSGRATPKVLA